MNNTDYFSLTVHCFAGNIRFWLSCGWYIDTHLHTSEDQSHTLKGMDSPSRTTYPVSQTTENTKEWLKGNNNNSLIF